MVKTAELSVKPVPTEAIENTRIAPQKSLPPAADEIRNVPIQKAAGGHGHDFQHRSQKTVDKEEESYDKLDQILDTICDRFFDVAFLPSGQGAGAFQGG